MSCKACQKKIDKPGWRKAIFCNRVCYKSYQKIHPPVKAFKKGQKPWNDRGGNKCVDCNVKIASYAAKRCKICGNQNPWNKGKHIKLNNALEKYYAEGNHWNRGNKGYKAGEEHYNWKGGITPQNKLEREKFRHEVLKEVLKRDGYACVIGGEAHGTKLQVDHIQPWKDYVELRFDINNCRTLCMSCHYEITFGKPMPPTVRTWGHKQPKGGTE